MKFRSRRRAFRRGHLAYLPFNFAGKVEHRLMRITKRGKLVPYGF